MNQRTPKSFEDPFIKKSYDQMKEYLHDNPDLIASYFATILACATSLGDFILTNHELRDLPRPIQHLLALTWNSYANVYAKEKTIQQKMDIDFTDYYESGGLDDRFALVVKQLHDICKEEKLL